MSYLQTNIRIFQECYNYFNESNAHISFFDNSYNIKLAKKNQNRLTISLSIVYEKSQK